MDESDLLVLMPVFDDWESADQLVQDLDEVLHGSGHSARILIVDDGSTRSPGNELASHNYLACRRIDVLRLKRNLGHQRAICIGLAYVASNIPCSRVVVMDSDGEDSPRDVPRMLDRFERENRDKIVFAERIRRSERVAFTICYHAYRYLHWLLVGHKVRVGNFSVIPADRLDGLAVVPELWSHFAAAVFASRQPFCTIPTTRAKRLGGKSKMNFVSLVIHGLSALAVFSDRIGVRLLSAGIFMIALALAGISVVVGVRLTTDLAIPGWATYTTGMLLIALFQLVTLMVVFSFITLSSRIGSTFIPARDHVYFVEGLHKLWQQE